VIGVFSRCVALPHRPVRIIRSERFARLAHRRLLIQEIASILFPGAHDTGCKLLP
jgi:hypothetical protein